MEPITYIDYADAIYLYRDWVKSAADDLCTDDECTCTDDGSCEYHLVEAHAAAYLTEPHIPHVIGGKLFGDPQPLTVTLSTEGRSLAYWIDSSEMKVADYRLLEG